MRALVLLVAALASPVLGEVRHTAPGNIAVEVDYEAWKSLARSGMPGFSYYTYAGVRQGEPTFQLSGLGEARTAQEWLAPGGRRRAGMSFFDTADGRAPTDGNLTPRVRLSCRGPKSAAQSMQGFVYFNATAVLCKCPGDSLRRGARPGSLLESIAAHLDGVLFNEGALTVARGYRVTGALATRGRLVLARGARVEWNPRLTQAHASFPPRAWKVPEGMPDLPVMFREAPAAE